MKENLLVGKVSHATDCAPDVLRHETQWQTADLEGSPDTLYRTLPQKHPPSWGPPIIPAPFSPPATILAARGGPPVRGRRGSAPTVKGSPSGFIRDHELQLAARQTRQVLAALHRDARLSDAELREPSRDGVAQPAF